MSDYARLASAVGGDSARYRVCEFNNMYIIITSKR